ncbi:MAG: hypothetical protein KDD44_08145, partial [Bdellovibrionales bacterium]|nr:hypothetical protein [Bdellovibrionales bacterium]
DLSADLQIYLDEELQCSVGNEKCWCFNGWYDRFGRPIWDDQWTISTERDCKRWASRRSLPCEWQACQPTYDPRDNR